MLYPCLTDYRGTNWENLSENAHYAAAEAQNRSAEPSKGVQIMKNERKTPNQDCSSETENHPLSPENHPLSPSHPYAVRVRKKEPERSGSFYLWERGERPLASCQLLWLPSKAVFRAQMAHFSFFGCMVPQTGHFTRFSSASAAKSFTSLHCGQQ